MNEALRKAQEAMAARRAAGETVVVLDPIQKAAAHPTSLRKAINGKCWDCVGAGHDPNPRKQIGQCPSTDCPLWNVRPHQKYAEADLLNQETASAEEANSDDPLDAFDDFI